MGSGLAEGVAELPVELESPVEMGTGAWIVCGQHMDAAKLTVSTGLFGQIAEALGRGQRACLGGPVVMPVPPPLEEGR
jgi:hypothetical protein